MRGCRRPCLGLAAVAAGAACGPAAIAPRATVPGVDPLSGRLAAVDVDLAGADLSSVRGPAGTLLTNAAVDSGRILGGQPPDCSLRPLPGGTQAALSARCAAFLGAHAAPDRARSFLLSAGADALPPAPVLPHPPLPPHAPPPPLPP